MALQLWFPQTGLWENFGVSLPDWWNSLLSQLPDPWNILQDIARGIWTSYYRTGQELIRRQLGSQIRGFVDNIQQQLLATGRAIVARSPDPVTGLVNVWNWATEHQRQWESQALLEGTPLFGREVQWDSTNLPIDGGNNQRDGWHFGGLWITMPGSSMGAYTVPQWMLYVLEEVEKDLTAHHNGSLRQGKRKSDATEASKKRRR
ncbi:TPA_asm: VP3 [Steenbok polyomavirus]|nr:TPA_asm: VP3 [Steenbok polyomavirus]